MDVLKRVKSETLEVLEEEGEGLGIGVANCTFFDPLLAVLPVGDPPLDFFFLIPIPFDLLSPLEEGGGIFCEGIFELSPPSPCSI